MGRPCSLPRLRVTREGKYLLGITVGIGLAAINTGNNLLFLLLGWLLSLIVASGVLSDLCLRGIKICRRLPEQIFANQPFSIALKVTNLKKRYASYSMKIEDISANLPLDKQCYFLKIPERESQQTTYSHSVEKRGIYTLNAFQVTTKFPFGLFIKTRTEKQVDELLVFPSIFPVQLPTPKGRLQGENQTQNVGRYGEFFGLREYREGDDRRSIHWRSSARDGRLLVREYENESQQEISLYIDNALPTQRKERDLQALEDAVSLCASLCLAYLEQGYSLRLVARGLCLPMTCGSNHSHHVLRALALLDIASDEVPFPVQPDPLAETLLVVPEGVQASQRPGLIPFRKETLSL